MSRALQYLREILTLLGEDRRKLPALVVLFLGVSLLDLAGLGLIAPYIGLVMKPEALLEGRLSELLSSLGGPNDRETLLLGLSVLLVVLFLAKAIAALGINNVIIGFAQNQQIRLRNRLIAHRLTTVKHCDRIYRLEQGRIVEEGTPEQVLQAPKAVSV